MAIAAFVCGQSISMNKAHYVMRRKIDQDTWQIEHKLTGLIETYGLNELYSLYIQGDLKFILDEEMTPFRSRINHLKEQSNFLESLSEKARHDAKCRYLYVTALRREKVTVLTPKVIDPIIDRVFNKLKASVRDFEVRKPSNITIRRWWKKYIRGGYDLKALINKDHLKGNATNHKVPEEVYEWVTMAINDVYLTRERHTIQDTLDYAITLVAEANKLKPVDAPLRMPTYSMVRGLIGKLDAYDVDMARYGYERTRAKYRVALNKRFGEEILEIAEIDHTRLDLMVIDKRSKLPLGRPNITVCIDVRSRCILGIYIGFEPPSFVSVAQCLRHAFLPKINLHDLYPSINGEWDVFGVPVELHTDRGMELLGGNIKELCYRFGMDHEYAAIKSGWLKPFIERFLGTLLRAVAHGQPGTTFANIFEKDDYDPVKHAIITLDELREKVHKWVVDVYHQSPHRGLGGKRPIDVWQKEFAVMDPMLPPSIDEIDANVGATETRMLTHKGIVFDYIEYNSLEMNKILRKTGKEIQVAFRYNPTDLGSIYVEDPNTNQIYKVDAKNQEYACGLSHWQHKVIKRHEKEMNKLSRTDIETLAKAKVEVMGIVQRVLSKSSKKSKGQTNAKAARFMEFDTSHDVIISQNRQSQEKARLENVKKNMRSAKNKRNGENPFKKDGDDDVPDFDVVS